MNNPKNRALVRVVAPSAEPVTLSEAKEYLRITHNDDDSRINDLIITARSLAEQWLKRSLATQSWKIAFDCAADASTPLPMGPVQNVTLVQTFARDNTSQTISSNGYALNAAKDALLFDAAPVGFRVEITYVAGYGAISQIPRPIKSGILAHIAAMFDGCTEIAPIPNHVLSYYMPYRELSL